jgi:Mitochondrial K+-H+ exchange-related
LDDAVVYLVPLGSGRFELYSEPLEDTAAGRPSHERDRFWRRQAHRLHERWRQAAHAAHAERKADASAGRWARARDWMVRRIAESIAEQRTLWSLRGVTTASFVYPSDLSNASAAAVRERLLTHARRHHGWWLLLNVVGVAVTAILVLLPGPNLIGYYFAFRVIGHYLSWRGARQALDRTAWRASAEPALTELGRLAHLPRDEREERVALLAAGLHLPRLAAFFDRAAVPAR